MAQIAKLCDFRPALRRRIHEDVAEQLRDAILDGRFPAGSKLPPERELAIEFEVNRTSVRDAMKVLEGLNLVRVRHGGGATVQPIVDASLDLLPAMIFRRDQIDMKMVREMHEVVRPMLYEMARLAFESDSTRIITLFLDSTNSPAIDIEGVSITDGYHNLSHHGKNESKLAQLEAIDTWHMKLLAGLLNDLKSSPEGGQTLLDRSIVLYGSNFGDANKHTTTNMPIILAGGGFKHGQHLAFDTSRNYPLPNLFVSMMQRMGIQSDRFASSTGTMRGLELRG